MPLLRIDITGPKSPAYKRALLTGARAAVTGAFGAPDGRVTVRVVETPASDVDMPSCRTERFTLVDVLAFEGRTPEIKAAMAAALREAYAADPGIEPSEVAVSFRDAVPHDLDVLPGEATGRPLGA